LSKKPGGDQDLTPTTTPFTTLTQDKAPVPMQSAVARFHLHSLAVVHRTAFSRSVQPHLSSCHSSWFSSSGQQQIRASYLRAGPGRNFGAGLQKNQQHSPLVKTGSSSASSLSPDPSGIEPTEQEAETSSPTFKKHSQPYKEIILLETDFRERFIKGGGNGGQKINKTNSNVELKHHETGIVVQCQATRSLPQNRKLARKILINRLDEYYNGEMSKRGQKAEKIRQRKMRMARKSAKKYHGTGDVDEHEVDDESDAILHSEGDSELGMKTELGSTSEYDLEGKVQLTTLEEILARDNRKTSRRKAARKE